MEEKVIQAMQDNAVRTDKVNRRLTVLAIVMSLVIAAVVVAFCLRDRAISHDYFTQDYNYATTNQNAADGSDQSQKIVNGVDTYGDTRAYRNRKAPRRCGPHCSDD